MAEGRFDVRIEPRPRGEIAYVTLDNQAKLNTLNSALMERFAAEIDALAQRAELRALVLSGAGGRAFIGGADIDEMASLQPETARSFITRIHLCCEALRRLPVPVIARIEGYALGAGLEIAAACDLRIAAESAVFGMPEVRIGIPSVVEAAYLPTLIGFGRTRQILLLGENFSAAQAHAWGLVERVVAREVLNGAVEEWLEALLACSPNAIRLQKPLIQEWERLPPAAAVEADIEAFVKAWQTPEPGNAMREFLAAKAERKRARAQKPD